MNLFLWIAGTLGLGAAALGLVFWRHLQRVQKEATQAEVLRHENQNKSEALHAAQNANEIRDRLRSDPGFANSVRRKYTRRD